MKGTVSGIALFGVSFILFMTVWAAVGIFGLGHFDDKFGGPWDNFILAIQLGVLKSVACTFGYALVLIAFQNIQTTLPGSVRWITPLVASLLAVFLTGTGVVYWVASMLPLSSISSDVVAYVVVGVVLAVLSIKLPVLFTKKEVSN